MKRLPWADIPLLMFLLTWASIAQVSAGETVPIRGRFAGTVQVTPLSASEPLFRVDSVAVGPVSHLGKAVAAWAVPEVVLDLVNGRLIVANTEWSGTITAANGDQIFGTYRFRANTVAFTQSGNFSFEVILTVTGGTGRFKNATGTGVAVGSGNIFAMSTRIELAGRISTVGSSRK